MTKKSSLSVKKADGSYTDRKLHEEILAGSDDTRLRINSAKRAIAKLGLTMEEAETLFSVTIPSKR
jgi:hypothetical protein